MRATEQHCRLVSVVVIVLRIGYRLTCLVVVLLRKQKHVSIYRTHVHLRCTWNVSPSEIRQSVSNYWRLTTLRLLQRELLVQL